MVARLAMKTHPKNEILIIRFKANNDQLLGYRLILHTY